MCDAAYGLMIGWKWATDWEPRRDDSTDAEGWTYALRAAGLVAN